jgi:hypothetical protein
MAIPQGYYERRQGGLSLYGILSVAFVFVLLMQLCRSMMIDTFGITQTRLDLAGFAVCHAIGAILVLRAIMSKRLMVNAVILCCLLITYIGIVITNTSIHTSLLDAFFSRYGILNWLLLGLGTAAAASYIALPAGSLQSRTQGRLFLLAASIVGAIIALFSINLIGYPVQSLSYQSIANNLISIILILMIFSQTIWSGRVPLYFVIGLLLLGTIAVTAIARLQSTSIVGFWAVALIIYFRVALFNLSLNYKIIALFALCGATALYLSSDLFSQTLETTRFSELLTTGRLSSIDSRLGLLADFGKQFSVSPIFGNFSAEVVAGSGIGNYPHSLLSFLTHTGLIGTSLLCLILFMILSRRLPLGRLSQPDFQQLLFMGAIMALGMLSAFMTWSVFWFMLGFMCKTPMLRALGGTR